MTRHRASIPFWGSYLPTKQTTFAWAGIPKALLAAAFSASPGRTATLVPLWITTTRSPRVQREILAAVAADTATTRLDRNMVR